MKGIELANGYTEINNPQEQLKRWKLYGNKNFSYDEDFLEYLEYGMPNSAGIALGIDRLIMFFMNINNINEVIPFSFKYFQESR